MPVPEDEIEAGAQALRQLNQGMKNLNPWERLPNATKRKWIAQAACVLTAAASAREIKSAQQRNE